MSKQIQTTLEGMGYELFKIIPLGYNQYKLEIAGEVHVQKIKDEFNVLKWEYNERKVEFIIQK